jgi:hypothetical protein
MGERERITVTVTARFRPASQVRADLQTQFSKLANTEWYIKSPFDDAYQCIAWAACYTDRVMWPSASPYWWFPNPLLPLAAIPEEASVDSFIRGFKLLGYEPCNNRSFELGYQKVAIYANDLGVTHMARQHFAGRGWLSKLGGWEDILHRNLEDVQGDMSAIAREYGEVVQILRRSWWSALIRLCLFRSSWAALKFWLYRLLHPSWIWSNITK